jgi:hypothetical protein
MVRKVTRCYCVLRAIRLKTFAYVHDVVVRVAEDTLRIFLSYDSWICHERFC